MQSKARSQSIRQAALFVAALFAGSGLAGCGGGGSASSLTPPAIGGPGSQGHSTMLTLRLDAPVQSSAVSRAKPKYLSPAMQSLVYVITGPGASTAVVGSGAINLTLGSPACASTGTLQPLTCTAQVAVTLGSSGNYTFNVATYDAPQPSCTGTGGACSTAPCTPGATGAQACSGNALSSQDVVEPLTVGIANTVSLSLGGVVASVSVTPLAPGYLQGDAHGLKLWGPGAEQLSVEPRDADGNTIVGAGAPTIAVTSTSPKLGVTAAAAASPNTFTLKATTGGSPAIVTPGTVDIAVALTAPASGGSVPPAMTIVPVTIAHSIVYAADQVGGSVAVFLDGNTTTSATITSGVNVPEGIAVDAAGTLYVANSGNATVTKYPAGSTIPSATISNNIVYPLGMAVDGAGTLYVVNQNQNVQEYPFGSVLSSATISSGLSAPNGVALDSAGTLYVANEGGGGSITQYPAHSTSPSATVITNGLNYPIGVTVDSAGTVYVSNLGNLGAGFVTEYPAGSTSPSLTITSGINNPSGGLAVDAAGTLYVGNYNGSANITEYAAGSSVPLATKLNVLTVQYLAVVPASVQP